MSNDQLSFNELMTEARYEEALTLAERDAQAARQAGSKRAEGDALQSQAEALYMLDRYEESLQRAQEAVEAAREAGDKLAESHALDCQARALRLLGRYEESLGRAQEAAEAARQARDKLGEAKALVTQARALGMLDRYEESLERAQEAAEAARAARSKLSEAHALLTRAFTARKSQQTENALTAARRAAELYAAIGQYTLAAVAKSLERRSGEPPPTEISEQVSERLIETFGTRLGQILQRGEHAERAWCSRLLKPRSKPLAPGHGQLVVLRQWPSYAAIPLFSPPGESVEVAGGYFLRWGNANIVIDPGLGFLAEYAQHGFGLLDIDGVVLTHYHIDHTGDVEALLTALFEASSRAEPEGESPVPQVDFLLSPGTFGIFAELLAHNPGVREITPLRVGRAVEWSEGVHITPVQVHHRDLTGRPEDSLGVRIQLSDDEGQGVCAIGITSDTAWKDELNLPTHFQGVDLLVVHLGQLYPEDISEQDYAPNHLGMKGIAKLLDGLRQGGNLPKLTLVSEIGKQHRSDRVELLDILEGVTKVQAICPSKMGMKIALPECRPLCDNEGCNNIATQWGYEPGSRDKICFRCDNSECPEPQEQRLFDG